MASRVSFVSETADRVLVLTNPGAGSRPREQAVWDLVRCLQSRGLRPEVVTDLDRLGAAADLYHQAGTLRAVVAAGGDGTVAEVVNRTAPDVPITVFPLGTANLLANYFEITCDPVPFAKMLVDRAVVRLDAGNANGRIFLLMVGCGFDGEVVERLHRQRGGKHISYWTYAKPILESIRSYEYPALRVHCELSSGEGFSSTISARWAFLVNLPCYAGNLQLAPEASGTDGLLNVCTFGNGSFWHGLRYLSYILLRRHRVLDDCRTALVTRIRIESDKPVRYQLDGDPGGSLPLDIELMPERMTLLAPRARILALEPESAAQISAGAT